MRFGVIPKDEKDHKAFGEAFKSKGVEVVLMDKPSQWIRFNPDITAGYFRRNHDFTEFMRKEYEKTRNNIGQKDIRIDELDGVFVRALENTYPTRNEYAEFAFDYLKMLEGEHVLVVNPAQSIRNACRKHVTYYLLARKGLPIPASFATNDPVRAYFALDEIGFPQVVKPCEGGGGAGIVYGGLKETSGDVTSLYGLFEKPVIIQEFVGDNTGDIRVIVLGDEVVGGIKRLTPKGLHKSNVTLGGKAEAVKVDSELTELSLNAADAVGCKIAGVDLILGKDGYKILEVNSSPSFTGFKKATKIPLEEKIVDYLIKEART